MRRLVWAVLLITPGVATVALLAPANPRVFAIYMAGGTLTYLLMAILAKFMIGTRWWIACIGAALMWPCVVWSFVLSLPAAVWMPVNLLIACWAMLAAKGAMQSKRSVGTPAAGP